MPKAKFSLYFALAMLIPTFVSLTIAIVFGVFWFGKRDLNSQKATLLASGTYIAEMIHETPLGLSDPALPRALKSFSAIDGLRITLIDKTGKVLADTEVAAVAAMGNHATRYEVAEALKGRAGFEERKSATTGKEYLYAAQPLRVKEEIAAVIRVSKDWSAVRQEQRDFTRMMAVLISSYLLLTILVTYVISGIFGSYLRRMCAVAERIASGRFDLRVKQVHIEELDVLGVALNSMAERIGRDIDALRRDVDTKEAFLKELQHRVKNNLMVISSILNLESGRIADAEAKIVLKEMMSRVDSISRIYETLYKSADLETVDLKPYLENLALALRSTFDDGLHRAELRLELESVRVDSKTAVPIGLILNECLTNALKYAFPPPKEGSILVRLAPAGSTVDFSVSDDGVGFPDGFRPEESTTLGLQLVGMLSRQLGAKLLINGEKGVSISLAIPISLKKDRA